MKNKSQITPVFYISLAIAIVFILWGVFAPGNVETVLGFINGFISNNFGWVYMLAMTAFVLFALFLVISPYGKIRLGKQNEKPQYKYFTWFSFLFTAGIDRKSTRLNSSHVAISYAVFCLKIKTPNL